MSLTDRFRALHQDGCFVMPNPWDRGSARILFDMGFEAVATTSAGHGRAIGKDDQEVLRAELVAHVRDLAGAIDLPINVDGERLFPDQPGGIAACVELLADAGAAGISIEDYNPQTNGIEPLEVAVANVKLAVSAAESFGLVVTARAENHLYGGNDLDDTIARLKAYRDAGAEVLYAPGLTSIADIERVVVETAAPINVLSMSKGPSRQQLADVGVRRISSGSALFNSAYKALRAAAEAFRDNR